MGRSAVMDEDVMSEKSEAGNNMVLPDLGIGDLLRFLPLVVFVVIAAIASAANVEATSGVLVLVLEMVFFVLSIVAWILPPRHR